MWLVILLGAALRLYGLGSDSLWVDEGYSLRDAATASAWSGVRPLFYALLHFWMTLGHSEIWLRLPAVIFGIGTVGLVYAIGRRLYGHRVGIYSALFTALSPLQINHSQEIRMYSLVTLLTSVEVLFFLKYVEKSRIRDLILCLILVGFAFMAHPLTIYMLLVFNVFFLFQIKRHRESAPIWFASQVTMGLASISGIPMIMKAAHSFGDAWVSGMAKPGALDFLGVIRDFNLWQIPMQHKSAVMAGNIYGVIILLLIVYGAVRAYKSASWQTVFAASWLVVPLVMTAIMSYAIVNTWMTRYMIYASPACYILMGLGINHVRRRIACITILTAVLILPITRLGVYYGKPHRPEWRSAVRFVEQNERPGDTIMVYRRGYRYVFDYYYTGRSQHSTLGPDSMNSKVVSDWMKSGMPRDISARQAGVNRTWFFLSYNENTGEKYIEGYIRRKYTVMQMRDFNHVRVYLVSRMGAR